MKPVKRLCAAAAVSLAALGATAARAAGVEVLNEGFDNVDNLAGWVNLIDGPVPGNKWFQGNAGIFAAQSGAPDSYAAANYLGGTDTTGEVINWLFTPVLELSGTTVLSFYTRESAEPGFANQLLVTFVPGTDFNGDKSVIAAVGGTSGAYPSDWQQYTVSVSATGSGLFGFRYFGNPDDLSYIGLDTVSVVTAVPEPGRWAMLALGLGLLPIVRRQARR